MSAKRSVDISLEELKNFIEVWAKFKAADETPEKAGAIYLDLIEERCKLEEYEEAQELLDEAHEKGLNI